jgi:hypothetical protein
MTGIQGGNFWSGFAAGALSSIASSVWQGGPTSDKTYSIGNKSWTITGRTVEGLGGNFANSGAGMIAFGTVAGGAGAVLTGGNFWQGAVTGLVVSGLNHGFHNGKKINDNGGDTTDYNYDDNGNEIGSTAVKFIGTVSSGNELRGYGYRAIPMATGAISEDNFIANLFTGGAVVKGMTNIASPLFGIGSKLFGNSVVNKGILNVNGRFFKMGWSTFQNSKGAWGYGIRIGVGVSENPNIALKHLYLRWTWTANEIANPIIKTLK